MNELIFENSNGSENIMEQFLSSDYYVGNILRVDRFLDSDKTIDIEKLELAIILLIEHLEEILKTADPIYINLGNMDTYVTLRGIKELDDIVEESTFILKFCQAVADENKLDRDIIVRFRGSNE